MLHFHQRDTENPDLKTIHMEFPMEKKKNYQVVAQLSAYSVVNVH